MVKNIPSGLKTLLTWETKGRVIFEETSPCIGAFYINDS